MTLAVVLTSLGGIVAFASGVFFIVRALARAGIAVRDNTRITAESVETLKSLKKTVDEHTIAIAVMQDRQRRR